MTEVFLSYSREDQGLARRYAETLRQEGFDVWWDQSLTVGQAFDQVTEQALDRAQAVVVLWSKRSVESRWVRAEASQALTGGRLAPVMTEPCRRPIMFELTQTADLSHWRGDVQDPAWRQFVADLAGMVGKTRNESSVAVERARLPRVDARMRGVVAGLIGALLLGAGVLWALRSPEGTSTSAVAAPPPVTLAVLPFANLSSSAEEDYFSDGLTEEILNQLAQIPALRLTGRTSSFSFKGRNEDLRTIGSKLGVANLLEGSVRKDGGRLRITAQLIRADDGTRQWSKTYDRELSGMFAVQDEVAKDVAQALAVRLDVTTLNRAVGGTTNVEAYDRYLHARKLQLSERTDAETIRERVRLTREAVGLDPKFVLAWDALAGALEFIPSSADDATTLHAEAARARAQVAMLAPDSWIVQRETAYDLWQAGKPAEAIAMARDILQSHPLTVEHAYPYINLIFAVGRVEETVALVRQLLVTEPLAMYLSRDQQWNLVAARRFDEADAEYQRSLSLDGDHFLPAFNAFLRRLARDGGDVAALQTLHRQVASSGTFRWDTEFQELGKNLGDRERMRKIVRSATARNPADAELVGLADALGDTDLALAVLRDLVKKPRSPYEHYWELWVSPYSGLRSQPGFKDLVRELGLEDYWRSTGDWGDVCRPVGEQDFECR